jgi:hypothetical protein
MELAEFASYIAKAKNHPERIKSFAWFLHVHRNADRFGAKEMRRCYDDTHTPPPSNMTRFLESLTQTTKPQLLRDSRGYRLSGPVRTEYDARFGRSATVVVVERLLADLPNQITDADERVFLDEALVCYQHGAWRAAIVMTWNLAYDHVLRWVLADASRLAAFNAGIPKRNKSKAHVIVAVRDDFEELKEDEVVDILAGVGGVTANIKKVLKEKLGKRNIAAHPSTVTITRSQVDDVITDLVQNVVLRFAL